MWGDYQQISYAESLNNALKNIEENPFIGRLHQELSEDYRCLSVKRHIIFYKITHKEIYIVRSTV